MSQCIGNPIDESRPNMFSSYPSKYLARISQLWKGSAVFERKYLCVGNLVSCMYNFKLAHIRTQVYNIMCEIKDQWISVEFRSEDRLLDKQSLEDSLIQKTKWFLKPLVCCLISRLSESPVGLLYCQFLITLSPKLLIINLKYSIPSSFSDKGALYSVSKQKWHILDYICGNN